jgi:hypothetical protein
MISEVIASRSEAGSTDIKYCLTSLSPLRPASLILIDRSLDMLTPLSVSGSKMSLFHRVLATNAQQRSSMAASGPSPAHWDLIDISLESPYLSPSLSEDENITMSGVSSLPIQITPSISPLPSSDSIIGASYGRIWRSFLMDPEDTTRNILVEVFSQCISAEGGSIPPSKKRGTGAELLAYLQALLASPGVSLPERPEGVNELYRGLGYNPAICEKYLPLLSLTLAAIDSLQRSSAKQFRQHNATLGSVRASIEGRAYYESRMLQTFSSALRDGKSRADAAAESIISEFRLRLSAPSVAADSLSVLKTPTGKQKGNSSKDANVEHPADIEHLFMSVVR